MPQIQPAGVVGKTNTRIEELFQEVQSIRLSTRAFAAGAIAAQTDFFNTAPVADKGVDFYDAQGILSNSGKDFEIHAMFLQVLPGAAATIVDMDNLISKGIMEVTTNQKSVGLHAGWRTSAGGGTFIGSSNVTAAATAVNGIVNGAPQVYAYTLKRPLMIKNQQDFKTSLFYPQTAGNTFTLTGAALAKVLLEGIEFRFVG